MSLWKNAALQKASIELQVHCDIYKENLYICNQELRAKQSFFMTCKRIRQRGWSPELF